MLSKTFNNVNKVNEVVLNRKKKKNKSITVRFYQNKSKSKGKTVKIILLILVTLSDMWIPDKVFDK